MKVFNLMRVGLKDARSRGKFEETVFGFDTFLWSAAVLQAYFIAFAVGMVVGAFFLDLLTGFFVGLGAVLLTYLTPLVRVIATPLYRFHKGRRGG